MVVTSLFFIHNRNSFHSQQIHVFQAHMRIGIKKIVHLINRLDKGKHVQWKFHNSTMTIQASEKNQGMKNNDSTVYVFPAMHAPRIVNTDSVKISH